MGTTRDYDPQAPFIAEDGYEYESLASYLVGEKADCWRNKHIEACRAGGVPEAKVQAWIEAFDGEDRTPTIGQDAVAVRALRAAQANFALDPLFGRSLWTHAPNAGDDYHYHLGIAIQSRGKAVDHGPSIPFQRHP